MAMSKPKMNAAAFGQKMPKGKPKTTAEDRADAKKGVRQTPAEERADKAAMKAKAKAPKK